MPKPPNILFIMSDDHAFHAISAYTQHMTGRPVINQTPNIDRIAKEGMLFENCFCTNSLCAPSRGGILTGTYNHKNGVTTIPAHMSNRIQTFPKLLHKHGYQTAIVGKWHLGHGWRYNPRGFDYWCILPNLGEYFNPKMYDNGKSKVFQGYVTDIITDLSLDWLKKRNKSQPFCLLVTHKAPHRSWEVDEKHKHMFDGVEIPYPKTFNDDHSDRCAAASHATMQIERDMHYHDLDLKPPLGKIKFQKVEIPDSFQDYSLETLDGKKIPIHNIEELRQVKYQIYMKKYLACIASIDDNVGRIMKYLEEEQLLDETIIVYTSDNGFFLGDHRWFDKRFMYEESLHNPFIVRYPKEVQPGSVNDNFINNIDIAETFLDYAGIPIPSDMQGRSFRPLLQGKTPSDWKDFLYYRYWENGTTHKVYSHYGVRDRRYKLIYYYCDPLKQKGAHKDPHEPMWELFDLEKDPYELHNVYDKSEYIDIVKKMTSELNEIQQKLGDKPYLK
jgi:arylsulfatase A-like enzyme